MLEEVFMGIIYLSAEQIVGNIFVSNGKISKSHRLDYPPLYRSPKPLSHHLYW